LALRFRDEKEPAADDDLSGYSLNLLKPNVLGLRCISSRAEMRDPKGDPSKDSNNTINLAPPSGPNAQ
jgi:hypothetical protein